MFFFFFLSSFCNVSSRVTVDQQENLTFSFLMFHLLPYFTFLILKKWFHLSNCHKTRQLGCSQIIINKIMTASLPPPSPQSAGSWRGVSVMCLWLCVRTLIFLVVYPSIYETCLHKCVCVCALQAVFACTHTGTNTHKEKKTKPISLFQTHQWSSWGSLVQSKTTILRCRQDPVESWNLSRRLLTWQRKTVGLAWISTPLTSQDWVRVKCPPLAGDYFIQSGKTHLSFFLK